MLGLLCTHIFSSCLLREPRNNIPEGMSTLNAQILVSKYHSPVKGTNAF